MIEYTRPVFPRSSQNRVLLRDRPQFYGLIGHTSHVRGRHCIRSSPERGCEWPVTRGACAVTRVGPDSVFKGGGGP